jgi:dTDP-4-dehydrorhamnose reductase
MSRLLILGANGQVGQAVVARARRQNLSCRALERATCDIADSLTMQQAVAGSRMVVNCAAYIDKAETEVFSSPGQKFMKTMLLLARACRKFGWMTKLAA